MFSGVRKYVNIFWEGLVISVKKSHEYKFNVFMNAVSQTFFVVMWIVFWSVLLANVGAIGEWTRPMAIMLTGFVMMSDALWQIVWASVRLYYDIPSGALDVFLVKPVQPLFAYIVKDLSINGVFPALIGFGLVLGTVLNYFELSIVKFVLALIIVACGAATITFAYLVIGCGAFWLGKSDALRTFYRSILFTRSYPTAMFPKPVSLLLTIYIPISLFGTFPVLVLTRYSLSESMMTALISLGVVAFWFIILNVTWRRGLRRYESQGG